MGRWGSWFVWNCPQWVSKSCIDYKSGSSDPDGIFIHSSTLTQLMAAITLYFFSTFPIAIQCMSSVHYVLHAFVIDYCPLVGVFGLCILKTPLPRGWANLFDWWGHSRFYNVTEGPEQQQLDAQCHGGLIISACKKTWMEDRFYTWVGWNYEQSACTGGPARPY